MPLQWTDKAKSTEQFGVAKSGVNMRGFLELVSKATVGPRGGEIVAYTKSGRPIYESKIKDEEAHKRRYSDWSESDHSDAYAKLGNAALQARKQDKEYRNLHNMAHWHHQQIPETARPKTHRAFAAPSVARQDVPHHPEVDKKPHVVHKACKACKACKGETCDSHENLEDTKKALKSTALAVPRHLQMPAYDPSGAFRSATQVSRMYTDVAPDVRATLNDTAMQEDPRTHRALEDMRRSQEIQELRNRMVMSIMPRGDIKFDPRHSG